MMTPEAKLAEAQEAFALAPQEPVSPATHAQQMQRLRRHVAGRIAVKKNRELDGEQLTAWDVLDIIRDWNEDMAVEFGRVCLLSGRVRP